MSGSSINLATRAVSSTIIIAFGFISSIGFGPVQAGGLPFVNGFEGMQPLVTVHWDGGGDGTSWADPVNWDGDALPQNGNAVVINDPGSPTVIYDVSLGTTTLHSLISSESLTLTGGALELESFSWTIQTLTVGGAASVTVFGAFDHSGGTVTGAGPLTIGGLFTWNSGAQSGAGETVANGGLDMLTGGDNVLDARTLTVNGPTTYLGDLRMLNGATLNNHGNFDIQNDEDITHQGGVISTFNNFGTLTKSGGTAVSQIQTHFINPGTVNANMATLTLGNSNTASSGTGTYSTVAPGTLQLEGSHTLMPASTLIGSGDVTILGGSTNVLMQGSLVTTGTLLVTGGTMDFGTNAVTVLGPFEHSGGTVTGTAQLTIDGLFTWDFGTQSGTGEIVVNGDLDMLTGGDNFLSGRTLTLNGTTTYLGDLRMQNGATINNHGTFDFQNDEDITHQGGAVPNFSNFGTLTKSGGAAVSQIQAHVSNSGTVNVNSGALTLGVSGTVSSSDGDFFMTAPGVLRLEGSHTMLPASSLSGTGGVRVLGGATSVLIQGSLLTTGTLLVSGGTLDFGANPVTVSGPMEQTGGTVTGTAQLTIQGLFSWTSGTQSGSGEIVANGGMSLSTLNDRYLDTRTLTLNGATTHAGDLRLRNGATINNNDTYDIQNNEPIRHSAGADPVFNNNDTLTKSAGGGNTDIRVIFNNDGSLSVASGSISFEKTFAQTGAGTLNVAIASAVDFDSFAITLSASLDGTLDISLTGGFDPTIGEIYPIMTFSSRAGTFTTVNGLNFDPGVKRFDINYGATDVTLEVVADP